MNQPTRNDVVLSNLPLVGYLVSEACGKSRFHSRDDLTSAGSIALIKCADSFDPTQGAPFSAYARHRVRGAIIDEMRHQDWASRSARRRMTAFTATTDTLTAHFGRTPTVDELSLAMGLDRGETQAAMEDSARSVISISETVENTFASDAQGPEESLLAAETVHHLHRAIELLPERMRNVVEQVYLEDRSVKEVAEDLGVSHAAVSQQRAEAVRLLRDAMALLRADDDEAGEDSPVRHSRIANHRVGEYLATVASHTAGGITRARVPAMSI